MRKAWLIFFGPLITFLLFFEVGYSTTGIRIPKVAEQKFLLQISFSTAEHNEDFYACKSHVVYFEKRNEKLNVIEIRALSSLRKKILYELPILGETESEYLVDFNSGVDRIEMDEDRTGEDYSGRDYFPISQSFNTQLKNRSIIKVNQTGDTLNILQTVNGLNDNMRVQYILSPYKENFGFRKFPHDYRYFGFYQTYPIPLNHYETILYATKFDERRPVVFVVSGNLPERYKSAIREGIKYWNRAIGKNWLSVEFRDEKVLELEPRQNTIQWVDSGTVATSHIQIDPFTGEILQSRIFIPQDLILSLGREHEMAKLRNVVAHEVGHALGLRHNFKSLSIMNYLKPATEIGLFEEFRTGLLDYDKQVIRHVYLGEELDLKTFPPFCTDSMDGCVPFAL